MKTPVRRIAVAIAALGIVVAACSTGGPGASGGAGASGGTGGEGGTVNIAINPWVGYEANAAVVAHLLENELGYTVNKKDLKEDVSWQGFETGEVDAVVENWAHDDLKK